MEVLAVRPVKQDEQTYKRWFDYADTGVYFLFPSAPLSFFLFSTVIRLLVSIAPCFLVFWFCGFSVFCASCCTCSGFFSIENNVLIFVLWIVPRLAWRGCF